MIKKIQQFIQKHRVSISVGIVTAILAAGIISFLSFIFLKPIRSFQYILVYIFIQSILPNIFPILLILISGVFGIIFYKKRKKRSNVFNIIFGIICFGVFTTGFFLVFRHHSCSMKDIRTFTYLSPIVLDENANYTSSSVMARDIGQGIKKILSEEINANSIVTNLEDKMAIHFQDFPQYLINVNSIRKTDSEHLAWKLKDCTGTINWLEFSNDGYLTNIQTSNKFPFLISNTNLDASLGIKDRMNRLIAAGVLESNESKGVYMGYIYKALLESTNANYFADERNLKSSLDVINFSREQIKKLNSYLINKADQITDSSQRSQALAYIDEDQHQWNSQFEYLTHYTYASNQIYDQAEDHLRNAFTESLSIEKSFPEIFKSFQDEYFRNLGVKEISKDDFLAQVRRNGYTSSIIPNSQYINLYFTIIQFDKVNRSFDYDSFFNWLDKQDPKNPLTYMFWGKLLTLNGKFSEGAQKYHIAYEIYPGAPILELFEQMAYFNSYDKDKPLSIEETLQLDKIFEQLHLIENKLQSLGYDINKHETCGADSTSTWSEWCAQ